MLQVSPGTPQRRKRRKFFAIRHFPPGCGPNAVKESSKLEEEENSSRVTFENGKVTDVDKLLGASVVEEVSVAHSLVAKEEIEVPVSVGDLHLEVGELPNGVTPVVRGNDIDIKLVEVPVKVQVLEKESSQPPRLENGHCTSWIYAPPKRRKVSAIRQFPPGCTPNRGNAIKDEHKTVLGEPTLVKAKDLVVEKMGEVSDVSVSIADAEVVMEKIINFGGDEIIYENGHGVSSEQEVRTQISSPKSKSLDEKNKPLVQEHQMVRGSAMLASAKDISSVVENMPLEKQLLVIEDSEQFEEADKQFNYMKPLLKQATATDGHLKLASAEKARVENIKYSKGKRFKENDIDGSILVRSNSGKLVSGSGNVQIKSPLRTGPNGILIRSSSDKTLDSHKGNQSIKSLQTKTNAMSPTASVVKSQLESKQPNKEGKPLLQELPVKDSEFIQKGSKKRKLPAEVLYKGCKSNEGDDSLEVIGERMVIQALMVAENCPWRNLKKHGEISAGSLGPKGKMKKEDRNFDTKGQRKKQGVIRDDEYMLEKEQNMNAITVYQKPSELNITMTPFVPSEYSKKGGDDEVVARHKVKRVLRLFQLICRKILQGEESGQKKAGKINRIDLQASTILKDNGECVNNSEPIIGHVPGVEIGDEFHYRVELSIVGLHRPFQAGIDFNKKNGMLVATSIVASGGYQDDVDSSDILIYSGSGGNSAAGGDKVPGDQKLERGNLALKNCIDTQTPVRVIHGFKEKVGDAQGKLVSTFTYDGLYYVETYWLERGPHGFNVFRFQLKRMAGQPELPFKELKRSAKLDNREGLCVKDISQGKERIRISVVNTIDNELPSSFRYITKSTYPSWYSKKPPRGCDCTNGCSDSDQCACAVKNGGEIPFNFNGAIVQAKPLIYECGPSCKCPPSCHNRVSQHGIRVQLEVFKTRERGWGVRSLRSISSGSFVCEYIGELLQDGDAEQRTNDEYLFDIGHNYDDRSLWEDLPSFIPELQSTSSCDSVESVGFTIDAAEFGNVGRFINHSCSPNLYAQNVLYDHDDKRVPHIMFFAVDNIPPLQELTYHYNYTLGQVRDSEGNIKQKACYCGSPECCGRLY
ncbi:hypothetical protein HPP92_008912 [Vanilla planifolia]|uniref:Uncharacterized protein n=1 Tax=Vanilla planifolia TaxID=51239 RepID=A0A835V645_VANPL|nr:hypothetical protein HPP92_008912 [Vanilla planifolia]